MSFKEILVLLLVVVLLVACAPPDTYFERAPTESADDINIFSSVVYQEVEVNAEGEYYTVQCIVYTIKDGIACVVIPGIIR